MPPKSQSKVAASSSSSSSKKKGSNTVPVLIDGEEEEPLSAVILADSFDSRFSPLTLTRPRCLLPLCGVPLINFTLERLLQARASKVYVLSKCHTDLVRQHIDLLRNSGALTGLEIVVYALPSATSVGHAMQDLDSKQVIRGDFILIQPDAIGNVDLREMVRIHIDRKKIDRDAIMTIGMMSVDHDARNSPPSSNPVVAIRPSTQQLLHWASQAPSSSSSQRTSLPYEDAFLDSPLDASGSEVELRVDLRETGVDICSMEVPPLFSENFDYQKLRRDFVVGILTSDLLDSKLYVHIANEGFESTASSANSIGQDSLTSSPLSLYGVRCDSTRAYDGITLDLLSRLTRPFVPGAPAWPGERLECRLASRFQGMKDVEIARSAIVGSHTLVSSRCFVGEGAQIAHSTLCEGVVIGQASVVKGSHLFKRVQVGTACEITSAIIGQAVKILDGVTLQPGCIIADGCVIGPDVIVKAGSRVAMRKTADTRKTESEDDEDESHTNETQKSEALVKRNVPVVGSDLRLGSQSVGFLWPTLGDGSYDTDGSSAGDEDGEDDDENMLETPSILQHLAIGADIFLKQDGDRLSDATLSSIEGDSEFGSELDSDDESILSEYEDDFPTATPGLATHLGSLAITGDESAQDGAEASARQADFDSEASASLDRAFDEGHTIDNATIELKTLRMASNVPPSSVRKIVVHKLMERCDASDVKKTGQWLSRWSPLLNNIGSNGKAEGCETILFIQEYCARDGDRKMGLFTGVVTKLYNDDLIGDEGVLQWSKDPRSEGGEMEEVTVRMKMRELKEKAKAIVEHAEESSDDDSDDD